MDSKEQIIVSLKRENDFLKAENEFLKIEFIKLTGTFPSMKGGLNGNNENMNLPMINSFKIGMDLDNNHENTDEIQKLKDENIRLKKAKEVTDRQNNNLLNENMIIESKLNNLENIFIGSNILRNNDGSVANDMGENYNMSSVNFY
jgi:cell division protein FtsB